jgi:PASTA domain
VVGAADRVQVPDVTKKRLAEAKEILTKARLKVGTITSRKHDLIEEIVLEQTPEAGTEVGSQTPINLVVARKGNFEDVLDAITKHKDIGKISIRAATLIDRLSTLGVDSLENLVALETLSDLELRSRLNLRTLIGAQMLRKVINTVIRTKRL